MKERLIQWFVWYYMSESYLEAPRFVLSPTEQAKRNRILNEVGGCNHKLAPELDKLTKAVELINTI